MLLEITTGSARAGMESGGIKPKSRSYECPLVHRCRSDPEEVDG